MDETAAIGRQPDLERGDLSGQTLEMKRSVRDIYSNTATLNRAIARQVHATQVIVRQGGIQNAEASEVEIRQGAAGRIQADSASLVQGGVGMVKADTVTMGAGSRAAGVLADQVGMEQSGAQVLVSRGEVSVDQSGLGLVVASQVKLTGSSAVIVIAQKIEGEVRPLFGPAAAAVFGAVFGLVTAIALLLGRRKE